MSAPIFFTYPESVFGRKLQRYLDLRGLPYTAVRVPPNMPRPMLEKLGINHRRIPILVLGRDVYCDTRLIIRKLEQLFPDSSDHPALGAKDSFGKGFESMVEAYIIDAGPFWRTSGVLPPQAPLLQNDVWMKDRSDGSGGAFSHEVLLSGRSWCISQLRIFFSIIENIVRGRQWLLSTDTPGLADCHAAWVFDWAINMAEDMQVPASEEEEAVSDLRKVLNAQEFPNVHDWVARFRMVCKEAKERNLAAQHVDGDAGVAKIVQTMLRSDFMEQMKAFESDDVLGLVKGQQVNVTPADFGYTHADKGALMGLTRDEVVIEVPVPSSDAPTLIRLHFPHINFKISPA